MDDNKFWLSLGLFRSLNVVTEEFVCWTVVTDQRDRFWCLVNSGCLFEWLILNAFGKHASQSL